MNIVVFKMGPRRLFVTVLSFFGFFIADIHCQCSLATSLVYQEIAEDSYDGTWHDISAPGEPHPQGFYRNNTVYGMEELNPCISLADVTDRHVEVMFEVIPSVPLCYSVNGGAKKCVPSGRHHNCMSPTDAATNLYEFFADAGVGSSESDATFWYRLVRGPPRSEDTEDEWCMNRPNRFPGDSLQLPPNFTNPPENAKDPNSAVRASGLISVLILSFLIHMM